MARFISPHEKYSIQVVEARERIVTDAAGFAKMVTLDKPVIANFQKTGLLDHEIEEALMNFDFSGVPDGVNPITRISVFDTELYVHANFDEDERDAWQVKIDQRMRGLQEDNPSQFIEVTQPAAEKPWPKYDTVEEVDEVLRLAEMFGVSPEKVRLYELENKNRSEIVAAMLRLEGDAAGADKIEDALTAPEEDGEIVVSS